MRHRRKGSATCLEKKTRPIRGGMLANAKRTHRTTKSSNKVARCTNGDRCLRVTRMCSYKKLTGSLITGVPLLDTCSSATDGHMTVTYAGMAVSVSLSMLS